MAVNWTRRLACVGFVLILTVVMAAAETDLTRVKQAEAARVKLISQLSHTVIAVFRQPGDKDAPGGGGGSGVIIGTDGTALTNYHVVGLAKTVFVGTSDGVLHDADVIGTDLNGDIAVIRLKDGPFEAARLGDSDKLEPGDSVLAMGNPFLLATDFAPTVSLGIISGNHRYLPGEDNKLIYTDCIQIDAAINPGNSGGPLFAISGELVGINGRISGRDGGRKVNTGVGFAIPINQIKLFLPDLVAGKPVHHGILGVESDPADEGVKITKVYEDSAAAKAGIKVGDRVLSFQGRDVNNPSELRSRVGLLPAGSTVTLSVERDGKQMTVEAKLDARPAGDDFAVRPADEHAPELPAMPGTEPGQPTPQSLAKQYADAVGGYLRLDSLKTCIADARVRMRLPTGGEVLGDQKVYQRGRYSERVEQTIKVGPNVVRMVSSANEKQGWKSSASGVEPWTAESHKDHMNEAKAFEQLEKPDGWTGIAAEYTGIEKVSGEECHVVKTTDGDGAVRKWYFDSKTGLLTKYSHYSADSKANVDDYFEDYRDIGGGLKQPFRLYRISAGVRVMMIEITKVVVNPELDNALFDEPPKQIIGPQVY